MKPLRVQRSRQHKQTILNGLPTVYVGRPTKWGNPFKVGEKGIPTREVAVALYKDWIENKNSSKRKPPATYEIKKDLSGKNLSCWCPLNGPCHADVLLVIANGDG